MNTAIIRYILGWVMTIEGGFLFLPCLVSLIYQEAEGWYFASVAIVEVAVGLLCIRRKPASNIFYIREGCISTALSWLVLSLVGCLPFYFSGEIPSFTDALFETISGFTTTGASILTDVESLSHCMLFWRSFTHWLGGMGVLVFLLAVVQMPGGSHMNLMKAESPGPSVGKFRPKVRQTARTLYLIYLGMTLLEVILLLLWGMPLFDALTTSFGTAGTGGFGIKNSSIAGYSAGIQWIVTIFMILFGVNFNVYYLLLFRKWKQALQVEELRVYLGIILAAIGIIAVNIWNNTLALEETIRQAAFQVASIITTTGFATVDFNVWPETSRTVLVILMFIGACAGSTGGGIKVSRFTVLFKTMFKELHAYVFPKSIKKIKIDGKPVEHEVLRSINVFFITFTLIFVLSVFCLSIGGTDPVTNFTAVAATINNIGPGLELVGPTNNFSHFSVFSKYVLMFDMLAGRLELFPMLLLCYPPSWKGLLQGHRFSKLRNFTDRLQEGNHQRALKDEN